MIRSVRLSAAGLAVLALAACGAEHTWSTDEEVARAAYVAPGPSTVTLITSVNTRNNSGAHTALLIDGAQRLMFDPAGNWYAPGVPERNDVFYGMSPVYMDSYLAFQSAGVYEVTWQEVEVSPEVAQQLSQVVQAAGPVNPAFCSQTISGILSDTPGFEQVNQTFFPLNVMEQFATIPGVRTEVIVGTLTDEEDLSDEAARAHAEG